MTACERFENEGLTRFVAGEPLEAHFEECADCRAARASYQAVASALHQAKDAYTPPGDWEAKVWARIQRAQGPRRWPALLGIAAAAAALAVFFVTPGGGAESLTLAANLESGSGPVFRGAPSRGGDVRSAVPGDVLHLVLKVPRGKKGDVRVYRDAKLVFQCSQSPDCVAGKDTLEARVPLERAGSYRTVSIAADKELPEATGDLDTDYAAARRSGRAEESVATEVR